MLNFLLSLYNSDVSQPWGRISHVIVAFDGGGSAAAVLDEHVAVAPAKYRTFRRQLSEAYKVWHLSQPVPDGAQICRQMRLPVTCLLTSGGCTVQKPMWMGGPIT
jgi:hypothetical protein